MNGSNAENAAIISNSAFFMGKSGNDYSTSLFLLNITICVTDNLKGGFIQ
jgi:hypothetical protein